MVGSELLSASGHTPHFSNVRCEASKGTANKINQLAQPNVGGAFSHATCVPGTLSGGYVELTPTPSFGYGFRGNDIMTPIVPGATARASRSKGACLVLELALDERTEDIYDGWEANIV